MDPILEEEEKETANRDHRVRELGRDCGQRDNLFRQPDH
jgi:hypothetical protein